MKVRVTVTLDIDQQAWAVEYGLDPKDVRADVQEYMQNAMHEWVRGLGLGT